jgi:enoyl-CoA hydratase/carnithine racemase
MVQKDNLEYTEILVEKEYPIGYITLNRPDRLNAVTPELREQFSQACYEMRDDPQIRVFVIKGAGNCFCSGIYQAPRSESGRPEVTEELPEVSKWIEDVIHEPTGRWARTKTGLSNPEGAPLHFEQRGWYWEELWENPKPSIAIVHSYCLGAGLAIANACDVVYATPTAVFSYPPIRRGASITVEILPPWLLGHRKCMLMALTGEAIDAEEAYNAGLVTRIVPEDQIEEKVKKTAMSIAKVPPMTNLMSKRVVNSYFENLGIAAAKDFGYALCMITENSAVPGHYQDWYEKIAQYGFREANQRKLERYGGDDEILQRERARLAEAKKVN